MPGSRHSGYYEVLEALAEGGCPVCGLAARSVRQRLASLSYEQVNDPAVRDELRAAQGFCRRHAWQFLELGGTVLGAAIIYADILRSVRRRLPTWRARRRGDGSSGLLGGLLGSTRQTRRDGPAACPACTVEREAAARYLETVIEHAPDPAFQSRYEAADGLCLPHLADALERADQTVATMLVEATERKLGPLLHDLDEFIRKHDYRFRPEGWKGREPEAPGRAVRLVAGDPLGDGRSERRRSPRRSTSQGSAG